MTDLTESEIAAQHVITDHKDKSLGHRTVFKEGWKTTESIMVNYYCSSNGAEIRQ